MKVFVKWCLPVIVFPVALVCIGRTYAEKLVIPDAVLLGVDVDETLDGGSGDGTIRGRVTRRGRFRAKVRGTADNLSGNTVRFHDNQEVETFFEDEFSFEIGVTGLTFKRSVYVVNEDGRVRGRASGRIIP